jgi:hypothetical protein
MGRSPSQGVLPKVKRTKGSYVETDVKTQREKETTGCGKRIGGERKKRIKRGEKW